MILPLTLLASATGARTWIGIAAVSRRPATKAAAVSELIYDKVPRVPQRVAPVSLLGRVAAGAIVGLIVGARTGRSRVGSALAGGVIAFAGAHATYRMRRALGTRMPATAAALLEDGIVIGAAAIGAARLRADVRKG